MDHLDQNGVVLIDFYADWCGSCKRQAPILEQLKKENKEYQIHKINIDKEPAAAERYKIMGIPTLVFLKDGKEAGRMTGLQNKQAILQAYRSVLA